MGVGVVTGRPTTRHSGRCRLSRPSPRTALPSMLGHDLRMRWPDGATRLRRGLCQLTIAAALAFACGCALHRPPSCARAPCEYGRCPLFLGGDSTVAVGLGSTPEEIVQAFGTPQSDRTSKDWFCRRLNDGVERRGTARTLLYPGLSVTLIRIDGEDRFHATAFELRSAIAHLQDGLTVGSDLSEVRKKLGRPRSVSQDPVVHSEILNYELSSCGDFLNIEVSATAVIGVKASAWCL